MAGSARAARRVQARARAHPRAAGARARRAAADGRARRPVGGLPGAHAEEWTR